MNRSTFQYHVDRLPDGTPLAVDLRPTSLGEILLAYEPDQAALSILLSDRLREAIGYALREYRPNITDAQVLNVTGVILAEDVATGRAAVHELMHVGTQSLYIRDIQPPVLQQLIEQIHQSNDHVEYRDLKWTFKFNLNTIRVGAGIGKLTKPFWATSPETKHMWNDHIDEEGPVNCAAFAICYSQATRNVRLNIQSVTRRARELMQLMRWSPEITISELGRYVQEFPATKMLILQEGEREAIDFIGEEYVPVVNAEGREEPTKDDNLIRVIYIGDQRHYIVVRSFRGLLRQKKRWNYNRFCYKCNYCYNQQQPGSCKCDRTEDERHGDRVLY